MTFSSAVSATRPVSIIAVQWKNATGARIASLSNDDDTYAAVDWSDGTIYAEGHGIRGGSFGSGNLTTATIFSTLTDSLDAVFVNGSERTRTQIGSTGDTANFTTLGRTYSNSSNGRLAFVLAISSALTASQRKRIEHAAAFSWKISCN
jgi:hypothetical protein